jgi:hypothetical protein
MNGVSTLRLSGSAVSRLLAPRAPGALRLASTPRHRMLISSAGTPGANGSGAEPDVPDLVLIFNNGLV